MEIEQEYQRLRELYAEDADEKLLKKADHAIRELARINCDLGKLNELAKNGLVLYDSRNPLRQKALPVARVLSQTRASQINYTSKLIKLFGGGDDEDEDDDFDEY